MPILQRARKASSSAGGWADRNLFTAAMRRMLRHGPMSRLPVPRPFAASMTPVGRAPSLAPQQELAMSAASFPIELESRAIECRTEAERTMLTEAHSICCDNRISDRHSPARLRAISVVCQEYGFRKMAEVVTGLAEQSGSVQA